MRINWKWSLFLLVKMLTLFNSIKMAFLFFHELTINIWSKRLSSNIYEIRLGMYLVASCFVLFLLSWGLTTRRPLWVILCRLPEKGTREIEEIVEEMKQMDSGDRKINESEETEEMKTFPSTLSCCKDSRPCPTISPYQLDALLT